MDRGSNPPTPPAPIADAFVHVQCAYTSLGRLAHVGMIAREYPFFERVARVVGKTIALVSYGGEEDLPLGAGLRPAGWAGSFETVCNHPAMEPSGFQGEVPERIAAILTRDGCRTAIVYTDQHYGGEVAVQTSALLRARGVRVGLVARCGYHWSWTVARDTSPNDPRAIAAELREGELCRAADVVIGTTRVIAANLAWQHRLNPTLVRVVPNWVAPSEPAPGLGEREPGLVLFAGRLEAEKRVDLLIRAMAIVGRRHPTARLRIVGDGSLGAGLVRLAGELNAPVEFHPRLAHAAMLSAMGRCSIYAQVSSFEGHPKTILEAMAMGASCVVTRAPGVDEEIIPGVTGTLCGDRPEDIAHALDSLLRDRENAGRIGAAAAADIRARLSFDGAFGLIERALRDAMASAGAFAHTPTTPVRWDQTLLGVGAEGAAAEFASAIGAYAKRLSPAARAVFLDGVAARVGSVGEMRRASEVTALPDAPVARR